MFTVRAQILAVCSPASEHEQGRASLGSHLGWGSHLVCTWSLSESCRTRSTRAWHGVGLVIIIVRGHRAQEEKGQLVTPGSCRGP